MRTYSRMVPALLVMGVTMATTVFLGAQTGVRFVPDDLQDTSWLQRLRDAQIKAAAGIPVFHDFQFTDRLTESGISFVHRNVEDAGKTYKAVHYDHGNGMAIADVDGDGLYDIYFTNQVGGNQLWKNVGGGKFQDITASAGVAVAGKVSVSASFADINNDGDADLYVTTVRGGNMLFENDGKGRFRDISAASGLNYVGHSSGAVFFDYDRDGLLDLFLVNVGRYTTDTVGGDGYKYYVGVRRRIHRPSAAGAGRTERAVSQRGEEPIRRRLAADGSPRRLLVRRRERARRQR